MRTVGVDAEARVVLAMADNVTIQRSRLVFLDGNARERLNRFVMGSNQGHFRQLYEWGQVIGYDGTKTVHLGVEREGSLCASLALCIRRILGTPWTYLTGPRGPVMDLKNPDVLGPLVQSINTVARAHRAVFLRIDPDYPEEEWDIRQVLRRHGFVHLPRDWSSLSDPRIVMRVDLRPSEAELLAQMRKKHRQHIHGTERRGLRIRAARDLADVDRFAELMAAHGREKGFSVREIRYFHALWSHYVQAGLGEVFLVERNGEVCAGGLAVICGRKSWFLYTAIGPDARGLFPGESIYWEVMRWAKGRGAEICDFGGTGTGWPPTRDNPGYSRYFFKHGFNAQPVYLTGYYDLIFRPRLYRMMRFAEDHLLERGLTALSRLQAVS